MKTPVRIGIVILVAAAAAFVVVRKRGPEPVAIAASPSVEAARLPRLVDLGANACVPCKAMKPILDALRTEQQGYVDILFIDVWQRPEEATRYGVRIIPTQIFYDARGTEFFRHEGFMSREEILSKFQNRGVRLAVR